MVVLVTGANGQLGQAIKKISEDFSEISFVFADSEMLDITNTKNCLDFFDQHKPNYCINTAAYTAVDLAETEQEKAYSVNVIGVKNLAESCKKHLTTLIHISTDFVFDGEKDFPYTEEDIPNPKSVYGKTKLEGEQEIQAILDKYYIIRTSWVYSEFGKNFKKTMLNLSKSHPTIRIVNDQIGSPTNANCLARAILQIIAKDNPAQHFGLYHFSNEGSCSWYEFAKKIFELNKITVNVVPVPTSSYPTAAQRPKYSVLDTTKIKTIFNIQPKFWEEALSEKH